MSYFHVLRFQDFYRKNRLFFLPCGAFKSNRVMNAGSPQLESRCCEDFNLACSSIFEARIVSRHHGCCSWSVLIAPPGIIKNCPVQLTEGSWGEIIIHHNYETPWGVSWVPTWENIHMRGGKTNEWLVHHSLKINE